MRTLWVCIAVCLVVTSLDATICAQDGSNQSTGSPASDRPLHSDDKMAEIVQKVLDNEKLYQNLDVTFVCDRQLADPKFQKHWNASRVELRSRTVWQNDLLYFDSEETLTFSDGRNVMPRRRSAYDGQKTRGFEHGNSANVHLERHESSSIYPPHTWPLKNLRINFPLSVYLQGTEAIHKHPKVHDYPHEGGSIFEFTKVEASLEGEEEVDGLACAKIRCRRWYYSKDEPQTQILWLCPQRNFHCAKLQTLTRNKKPEVDEQAKVDQWREVSPGLWLPERITFYTYSRQWIESLLIEQVKVAPNHPIGFFRDIEIPDDLPVYTIKGGRLVEADAYLREPTDDSDKRLKEITDAIRANESHYATMEVEVKKTYRHFDLNLMSGGGFLLHRASFSRERSIVQPTRGLYIEEQSTDFAGDGGMSMSTETVIYNDGWARRIHSYTHNGKPDAANYSLQKDGFDHLPIHRPHMLLFRDHFQKRSLSDYLSSGWEDRHNNYRLNVSYLGRDKSNDLQCDVLRLDVDTGGNQPKKSEQAFRVVWLACDRNYLPIRYEWYEPLKGGQFPTGIGQLSELKELRPGVWFPMLATLVAHERKGMADLSVDEVQLQHRTEYQFESVKLESAAGAQTFVAPDVSRGVKAGLLDESGRFLGQFNQADDGPLTVSDEKYRELERAADERDKQRRGNR